jgi:RNA polymerase sigma-70 factor, ECF subfamily
VFEDKMLIRNLKQGNADALGRIYEKYRDDLLRISAGLLNNSGDAEDVVHEVFTSFVQSAKHAEKIHNLKGYLTTSVANRARNVNRNQHRHATAALDQIDQPCCTAKRPGQWLIIDEEFKRLTDCMAQLPYEQREVVILRLQADTKFKDIAKLQQTSVATALSRYRYGISKLRTLLNDEVDQ